MHVLVACPTLWLRTESASRLALSVANSTHEHVSLYYDGDEGSGFVEKINRITAQIDADAVLYAGDDQEFYPDCIEMALASLAEHFPDTDGMIGLNQEHGSTVYGIRLLGRKFLERFPQKAAECPDYTNYFGDQELWEYAKSVDRFYSSRAAIAKHHMSKDRTREIMRSSWEKDEATYHRRRHLGLLWGRDFERIW